MATCPLCNSITSSSITDWSFHCVRCNHWTSSLQAEKSEIENAEYDSISGDENAIDHLTSVRLAASEKILNVLGNGARRKLLDIGCAAGVFMDVAGKHGFEAFGVEPNKRMAAPGIKCGLNIRIGFFPDALSADEKFEIITFNDVFEHIEDIHGILEQCSAALKSDGYLSIAVPNSGGLFFRLAKLLAKLHCYGPWNRLWQNMFYTPHLHYFSSDSLVSCVERHGFKKIYGPIFLPVIKMAGLWQRLKVNKQASFATNILSYFIVVLTLPIYALMPKDSFFIVFKKNM